MTTTEIEKNLIKSANNFIKMNGEENCENIKIKFWIGFEEQIKNYAVDNCIVIKIIFEEILNISNEIIWNKNLLNCIISFLRGRDKEIFDQYFLKFVYHKLQNYAETKNLFSDFLSELMINIYIDEDFSQENLILIKKLFFSLIEFDLDFFTFLIQNKFQFSDWSLFFTIKEYNEIFTFFIEKLMISFPRINLMFFYLEKFENLEINMKNFENSLNFIHSLIEKLICKPEQTNSQNFILILSKIVSIRVKLINSINSINKNYICNNNFDFLFEKFLIYILEIINSSQKFNFSLIKIFLQIKEKGNFQNFNSYFTITLLNFSNEIYDTQSLKLYLNFLRSSDIDENIYSFVIKKLISKSIFLNEKLRYLPDQRIQIENNHKIVLYKSELTTKNSILPFYFYNFQNLELVNYIIKSSFSLNDDKFQFNEENFIQILRVLLSLNLEKYDKKLQNFLIKVIFQIVCVFYEDIYINSNITTDNFELFQLIFLNLEKTSDKTFLKTDIYPFIINFMQGILLKYYSQFTSNIFDIFFNYLFSFCRQDNIANLTSKLLVSLFNLKLEENTNREYSMKKYAEFIVKTNSSKFFTQYFNFCMDNLKKDEARNSKFIYQSLIEYSKNYEGSLPIALVEYIFPLFEKCLDNLPDTGLINLKTFFALNSVYHIFLKDQPEKISNKLYDYFYNLKSLKTIDKLISTISNIANIDQIILDQMNNINSKSSISFLIVNNPSHLALAILIQLSNIISLLVSIIIRNNNDKFDVKNLSDPNNKVINSLIKTFDYITNALLFSENKKNIVQLIFIDIFFSYEDNMNFFYNTHSYYMAIDNIEKESLDYSKLQEINMTIILNKNQQFIEYLKIHEKSVFLMVNLIHNILNYELSIFYLIVSKKGNNSITNQIKNFVVDSLYDNNTICSIKQNDPITMMNEKKNLGSFFFKEFLEIIYSTSNCESNIELIDLNENIYLCLLQKNTLIKYFRNSTELLNLDLILVNFYNVLRKYKSNEILKNFLNFLLIFSKINKNVFNFSLRILLNKNIFMKRLLLDTGNICNELFVLIEYITTQIIFYSSYKNESTVYILDLFSNLYFTTKDIAVVNYVNLTFYGKLIEITLSNLRVHIDEHRQIEINKKFKENLIQILKNEILINYLTSVFISPFSDESNIKLLMNEYNLISYFENLDLILVLKSEKFFENREDLLPFLKENTLMKNILLFHDISLPKSLLSFMRDFCKMVKDDNHYVYEKNIILENYLLHHVIYKNNTKLTSDITNNLLFNKEFVTNSEINLKWNERYSLISLGAIPTIVDTSIRYFIFKNKYEIIKSIGCYLMMNILKKSGSSDILSSSIDNSNLLLNDEQSKEFLLLLKN